MRDRLDPNVYAQAEQGVGYPPRAMLQSAPRHALGDTPPVATQVDMLESELRDFRNRLFRTVIALVGETPEMVGAGGAVPSPDGDLNQITNSVDNMVEIIKSMHHQLDRLSGRISS